MLAKDWLDFSCYCLQCPHMWMNKTATGHARLVQYGVGWWFVKAVSPCIRPDGCRSVSSAWIGSHRFTVACLFPVNTYPVWKRLNATMNDAWKHGCECEHIPHIMIPPASSRERVVLSCCVNRRYFPCIWERIMKHDVHEPFRTIHGCIRWERNLETGHDAIPRSFTGWVHALLAWFVLDSDAVCLAVSVISASYRVSAATDHRNGHMFTQEKEGLGNRMTSGKPHGWRHGFGLDALPAWWPLTGCVRRDGSVASVMLTVGMRCSWWWTLAGR